MFESALEIDINSGRIRTQRSILGCVTETKVHETAFSTAALQLGLPRRQAVWRRCHSISYGIGGTLRSSFINGQAPYTCNNLCDVLEMYEMRGRPFTEDEKRNEFGRFLELLRNGDVRQMDEEIQRLLKRLSVP